MAHGPGALLQDESSVRSPNGSHRLPGDTAMTEVLGALPQKAHPTRPLSTLARLTQNAGWRALIFG